MSSIKLTFRTLIIFYDLLLVTAIILVTTLAVMAFRNFEPVPPHTLWFQALLGSAVAGFYIGFWYCKQQTLGMKAWKVSIVTPHGKPTLGQCSLRFFATILSISVVGLGFFSALWHKDNLTWHDRISNTWLTKN